MVTLATDFYTFLSFPGGSSHEIYFSLGEPSTVEQAECFIYSLYPNAVISVLYGLR